MQGAVTKNVIFQELVYNLDQPKTLPVDLLHFFYAWLDWALVGALVKTWAVDYENNALYTRFKVSDVSDVTYKDFGSLIPIYTNILADIVPCRPIHGRIPNTNQDTDTAI